ncbi:uncharacterized protein LOC144121139 isoform X2 [Amblyomma americanum]
MEPFHIHNTYDYNHGSRCSFFPYRSRKAREERDYCKASSLRFHVSLGLLLVSSRPSSRQTASSDLFRPPEIWDHDLCLHRGPDGNCVNYIPNSAALSAMATQGCFQGYSDAGYFKLYSGSYFPKRPFSE